MSWGTRKRPRLSSVVEEASASHAEGSCVEELPFLSLDWRQTQQAVMPRVLVTVTNKIQQEGTSREGLLQLARFFRKQADLLYRQADHLDRLAADDEASSIHQAQDTLSPHASREPQFKKRKRQNVVALVGRASDLMLESHTMMDNIEQRLYPWEETNRRRKRGNVKKAPHNGYSLFTKQSYKEISERLGDGRIQVIAPEAGRMWKALTPAQQKTYNDRALAMRKGILDDESAT